MLTKNFLESTGVSSCTLPKTTVPSERESVQVYVIGSIYGITGIIYDLHRRGFAEVNDWSKPQPTGKPGEYVRLLRRYILCRQ